MREVITFTIPGEPVGKGRPRFVRATGRTYTPEKTRNFENLVRLAYRQQIGQPPFPTGMPLSIDVVIWQQIPKSVSKKKREDMLHKRLLPTKKPDCSNVLKAIEDGLNGVAYADDSQIVQVSVVKYYGEYPETIVSISEART